MSSIGLVGAVTRARNARIAAIVSSGALRFGQWPVAVELHEPAAGAAARARTRRPPPGAIDVVGALQHQRRRRVTARGRRGCRTGTSTRAKWRGDLRVGAAEAVGQLARPAPAVRVAHDHRRHRARPAEVVAVQRLEQPVDVLAREPAERTRRRRCSAATARPARAARSAPGSLGRGQHADHRADRVADEDRRRAARARRRSRARRRRSRRATRSARGRSAEVRAAGADVVEQDDPVVGPRTRATRSATCSGRSRSRARRASAARRAGRGAVTLLRATAPITARPPGRRRAAARPSCP